jgi:hypothetical protein
MLSVSYYPPEFPIFFGAERTALTLRRALTYFPILITIMRLGLLFTTVGTMQASLLQYALTVVHFVTYLTMDFRMHGTPVLYLEVVCKLPENRKMASGLLMQKELAVEVQKV